MTIKTRVLIVDDSVVIRRILSKALEQDPAIEVAAVAANGSIALRKIPQCSPDVVVLDVEMPVLDGLETLSEIRKLWPKLPVIMFSSLTERGASTTLEALARGATTYLAKPQGSGLKEATAMVLRDLVPVIKAISPVAKRGIQRSTLGTRKGAEPRTRARPRVVSRSKGAQVLAIGSSTGGPSALMELLMGIGPGLSVPIVITQHMPKTFTRLLAERLSARTGMTVREGHNGAVLRPGEAWIAPGGFHMVLRRAKTDVILALNEEPPENSCRPAVDVMFRSVAKVYGGDILAVVLTGMGKDGTLGSDPIHKLGGHIIAQDEESSVVWGMPGTLVKADLADQVLPLSKIAQAILTRIPKKSGSQRRSPLTSGVNNGRR